MKQSNYKTIPQPDSSKVKPGAIPRSVAEIHEEKERNLIIDFRYYNNKLCEINSLSKKAKNALTKLKIIGTSTRSTLDSNGIQLSPVSNSGDYKKLFNNLPAEFSDALKEHKFSGTCRIFCTLEGNKCNIVAITANHFELNKNRR